MRKDELEAPAAPVPAAIPVVCDTCRAAGHAGDPVFSAIPDILDFTPVPRRARVNNWTPEHQRAFIAALAITGSPRQAARALGRHAFGAEQLRRASGGKSFSDAWDAAMDLARERELARVHANLADLSAEQQAAHAKAPGQVIHTYDPFDDDEGAGKREIQEQMDSIRERLLRARTVMLAGFSNSPEKRAAWEVLCGPVDWEKAARFEAEEGLHWRHLGVVSRPGTLIACEYGLIPEMTGGVDNWTPTMRFLTGADEEEAG